MPGPSSLTRVREIARNLARAAVVFAALGAPASLADGASNGANERLHLVLDQAKLMKLPDRVATIVIGNPLIADASLQSGGLVVLTGKGYGATNIIALDRKGNALLEKMVHVHGPNTGGIVVVYKGVNRETYNCAPQCQPHITPGDFQQFFTQSLAQTVTRSSQASAMTGSR